MFIRLMDFRNNRFDKKNITRIEKMIQVPLDKLQSVPHNFSCNFFSSKDDVTDSLPRPCSQALRACLEGVDGVTPRKRTDQRVSKQVY